MSEKLKIGLIIGAHEFDSYMFDEMLYAMEDITFYPMIMRSFIYNVGHTNEKMDGFLFFNFEQEADDPKSPCGNSDLLPEDTLYRLGHDGKGLFFLHHALTAYMDCAYIDRVLGIPGRKLDSYEHNVPMKIHVADPGHPIMQGMEDFEVIDETYAISKPTDYEDLLLTTDNAKSSPAIMWTRKQDKSRLVCLALGHDDRAYTNPFFVRALHQGILWSCHKI